MTRNSIPSQPTILLALGPTASGNSEEEEKSETPAFFFAMSFATTSKLTVFCRQYSTAALPSTERVGLGLKSATTSGPERWLRSQSEAWPRYIPLQPLNLCADRPQ